MIRAARGLALAALLGAAACWTAPFAKVPRVLAPDVEPERVPARFAERLPEEVRVVHTVTFEYLWESFTALGLTRVDPTTSRYAIVGLHPTGGVKLFEVSGQGDVIETSYVQPQVAERGDLATLVAQDTRRIFLDRIPPAGATWDRHGDALRFRAPSGEGEIEYVFTGTDPVLVEKRYLLDGTPEWSVGYHEYREEADGLHPGGIVLEHHDYGYRLVLRFKEVLG